MGKIGIKQTHLGRCENCPPPHTSPIGLYHSEGETELKTKFVKLYHLLLSADLKVELAAVPRWLEAVAVVLVPGYSELADVFVEEEHHLAGPGLTPVSTAHSYAQTSRTCNIVVCYRTGIRRYCGRSYHSRFIYCLQLVDGNQSKWCQLEVGCMALPRWATNELYAVRYSIPCGLCLHAGVG